MVEREFPYNRSAYNKDKVTIISTTYDRDSQPGKKEAPLGSVLYSVGFIRQGNIGQKEMEAKLEMFLRNLIIYEHAGENGSRTENPEPKS
jgi:hypothetical protein